MKYLHYVAIFSLVFLTACTAPTQRIAAQAMQNGLEHTDNIITDLSNKAEQYALDLGANEVKYAVREKDEKAAVGAVAKAFNSCRTINWLKIQNERARAEFRIAQVYIDSQEGILDLMYKEFKDAKQKSDSGHSDFPTEDGSGSPATVPSSQPSG